MNESRNPYAPPTATVEDPVVDREGAGTLIENGRLVPVRHCWRWISRTGELFFQRPWKWLGAMLLMLVASSIASWLPYSNVITTILYPIAAGGIAQALDVQRRTGDFPFQAVFAGFGPKFLQLAALGAVTLLSYVVMFIVFDTMVGRDVAISLVRNEAKFETIPPNFWSALFISIVFTLPITAATYLAPPLVMLHEAGPRKALRMSFFGCLKNIVTWVLCGLLMVLLVGLSALPLLLGLFVTLPVAFMTFYSMYRDVFIEESAAQDV